MQANLKTTISLTLTLTILLPITTLAKPTESIWVLTNGTSKQVRKEIATALQQQVGSELEPTSTIRLVNAATYQTIGTLNVPAGSRMARLNNRDLLTTVRRVMAFLQSDNVSDDKQLNLPRLPAKIREWRMTDNPLQIVLVGSLMYDVPKQPLWKFGPNIPSDGCLKATHFPFAGGGRQLPGQLSDCLDCPSRRAGGSPTPIDRADTFLPTVLPRAWSDSHSYR